MRKLREFHAGIITVFKLGGFYEIKKNVVSLIAVCLFTMALRQSSPISERHTRDQLAEAADSQLASDTLADMSEAYVKAHGKWITLFAEYMVNVNAAGANNDEYGI
jgi:hypothetical protein